MTIELKALKGTLLKRMYCKLDGGKNYTTKEEDMTSTLESIAKGWLTSDDLESWIESLKEDLAKTPEQRAAESEVFIEELSRAEAEQEYNERMSRRYDHDEWTDFWASR